MWRNDLDEFLTTQRRDDLDSLVDKRNDVAHGLSTRITHVRLKQYYAPVVEEVDLLEIRCGA